MGVVLNTNMSALAASNNLRKTQSRIETAMERLSSGLRINRAADDAAGLAISERMRSQVNGLSQAQRNAQDGISAMQTADGGLNETHAVLQRMRTLAVQAANGTNSKENLRQIQAEMDQLTAQIDQIAYGSPFNGQQLLDGSFHEKNLQVGANAGDVTQVTIASRIQVEVPASPPRIALWDVYKPENLGGISPTVTVGGLVGGENTSVDVDVTPLPIESVQQLVDRLNANLDFSAAFSVAIGNHDYSDVESVAQANVIISAKTGGAGAVTVTGIPSDTTLTQVDPGRDEIPAEFGGYGAKDILGRVDVTLEGGSEKIPAHDVSVGGTSTGFGSRNVDPPTTIHLDEQVRAWGSGASDAIAQIDRAIDIVSRGRAEIGAYQNRLQHTVANLSVSEENLAASESRIRDADIAKEMSALAKDRILAQAGTAMLAQANQAPQSMLKLLPNGS